MFLSQKTRSITHMHSQTTLSRLALRAHMNARKCINTLRGVLL